jgi:hypothetical protein
MNESAEKLALQQALALTNNHADALQDALNELTQQPLTEQELENLNKARRRLLDQFAYRYTRLQDDMGNKLFPASLRMLGEDIAQMPAIDRFNRLEQLGWLASADAWLELRKIRNEFSHDYPEAVEIRYAKTNLAIEAAHQILVTLKALKQHLNERFPR